DPPSQAWPSDVPLSTRLAASRRSYDLTVTAGTPVLTQVNPNTGQQGQQSESVAITGQYTHFAQGTTTASFGAGITVASLTVNSAASTTALLNTNHPATADAPNLTTNTR